MSHLRNLLPYRYYSEGPSRTETKLVFARFRGIRRSPFVAPFRMCLPRILALAKTLTCIVGPTTYHTCFRAHGRTSTEAAEIPTQSPKTQRASSCAAHIRGLSGSNHIRTSDSRVSMSCWVCAVWSATGPETHPASQQQKTTPCRRAHGLVQHCASDMAPGKLPGDAPVLA